MKTAMILLATALIAGQAKADPVASACVIKAAETLPKIAGMKIGKSATEAVAAPPGWSLPSPPTRVVISWEAAGQAQRWAYLCAVDSSGNARVQRLKE